MVLLKNIRNIFLVPELTKRLLFTLFATFVYRIGTFIPVIGINVPLLAKYMLGNEAVGGGFLNYIDMFSAGSFSQGTLFALGVSPYITASIFMQMLSMSVPTFEQYAKEGEYGRQIINRYTRYVALVVSVISSIMYGTFLQAQGLVLNPGLGFMVLFVLSLVSGAMFVMWLGDQIKEYGIGSGSSMIIFAGIVARFPSFLIKTVEAIKVGALSSVVACGIIAIFLALTACIVFLEKGDRKIPVHYARRMVGNRTAAAQHTFIPFKINTVGVMPVIFAAAMLNIPMFLLRALASRFTSMAFLGEVLTPNGLLYNVGEFGLIIFFTYVYTALVYDPNTLADNLKKSGGFIPGIRPGSQTADYFQYVLVRIGFVGALYLASLAIFPNILPHLVPTMPFFINGTSLLIVVGVALEIALQVDGYLAQHQYEGFIVSGRARR